MDGPSLENVENSFLLLYRYLQNTPNLASWQTVLKIVMIWFMESRIMLPPKMSTSQSPENVNMLPYLAKGTLQCEEFRNLKMRRLSSLSFVFNAITRVLNERNERKLEEGHVTTKIVKQI